MPIVGTLDVAGLLKDLKQTDPQILIGPPAIYEDGAAFVVVYRSKSNSDPVCVVLAKGTSTDRSRFLLQLIAQQRGGVVIHDLDDELTLAEMAVTLWPENKRMQMVRNSIRNERNPQLQ